MSFLELIDVYKEYGDNVVLKDVNFVAEQGSFLVLLGPSGCGKSTLLNVIAGLVAPDDGLVRIDGSTVNDLHPSKRDIAMVFQSYALYPNMTVSKNISFALEMRGVGWFKRRAKVNEVAKMLQLTHLLRRKPSQLSGGQRQRVAMGRALVRNPKLFLFDEPLSNLDARLRLDMRSEIKKLQQTLGTTTVYVTHDQVEAMTLASEIIVMRNGQIQQRGTPHQIYHEPANTFVANFVGSPPMNMIVGRVDKAAQGFTIRVRDGDAQLELPARDAPRSLDDYVGRDIILGLRPEAITDVTPQSDKSQHVAVVEMIADLVEPTGSDTFVETQIGDTVITARMAGNVIPEAGKPMRFAINTEAAVYFDTVSEERIHL